LDFRESALLLNVRNQRKFAPNMIFNLAIGFQDLELKNADKIGALGSIRNLSKYSMLVADTVIIRVRCSACNPKAFFEKNNVRLMASRLMY